MDLLTNAEIAVMTVEVIGSEVVIGTAYAVVVLATMGDTSGVGADMDPKGSAAIMTALDFELPTSLYALFLSCWALSSC